MASTQQSYSYGLSGTEGALDFPERSPNEPISGVVSLRELTHPISKKAVRAAYEAQKSEQAGDLPGAIAKLEKAIRIEPAYRDAHLNLGVQYARMGRSGDARAEFQKSLDIGPPASPIFADLALISLASHQYREAETFARKALELDPANRGARRVLQYAAQH
jgi:tetratricopeptide (TPR) repeat protein